MVFVYEVMQDSYHQQEGSREVHHSEQPRTLNYPEGPSTHLVSNTIKGMVFGARNLTYWVLGPSGTLGYNKLAEMI